MNWNYFLIVIRWQNVFIIWLMQSVVYFRYVLPYCGKDNYSFPSFLLFLTATGTVLGAGNLFNDIRDLYTDSHHPTKSRLVGNEITLTEAWNWYYYLHGLLMVIIIAGYIFFNWSILLAILFPVTAVVLYLYSTYFKSTTLIGNFMVALLCGCAVWITTLLDNHCELKGIPELTSKIPLILYGYIVNAVGVTMVREIVKDKEDAKWDVLAGIQTVGSLPDQPYKWILNAFLGLVFLFNVWWFQKLSWVLTEADWYLGLFMIFIPLGLIAVIFNLPHRPSIYSFLSKLIKIYILFALMLLILWQRM